MEYPIICTHQKGSARRTLGLAMAIAGALVAGCGARSELYAPPPVGGASGALPSYCADADPQPILVVTDSSQLFRFEPPSASFTGVQTVDCATQAAPETMAVAHAGTGYVTFMDGSMFEVDPNSGICVATAFNDGPNEDRFGSCFAARPGGRTEALFMMDNTSGSNGSIVSVDLQTFAVNPVGGLSSFIGNAELTGTGDGRLFAFGDNAAAIGATGGDLAEIDPSDATVLSEIPLSIPVDLGFAFAFWGGDFYFFVGTTSGDSSVARLAADGALDPSYATLPGQNIVGAGVSTCAPLH